VVCECGGGSRERNDTRRESVFDGILGGYVSGDCRLVVCVRFRSLSADARVGMMTLKSVCGACLWGDVTWNRVGSIEAEIRFIGGFNLRVPFPLLNGSFQKTKAAAFSRTNQVHYGDPLSLSVAPSSQKRPILQPVILL